MFWWSQVIKRLQNLKNWFRERGYLGSLIAKWLEKVKANSTEKLLRPKGIDCGAPFLWLFITHTLRTYVRWWRNTSCIIKLILTLDLFSHLSRLSLFILYKIQGVIWSKLYPLEQKIGSTKCNSPHCLTCNNVRVWYFHQSWHQTNV